MRALCRIQWGDAPAKVVPGTWSVGVVAPRRAGLSNRLCPYSSHVQPARPHSGCRCAPHHVL